MSKSYRLYGPAIGGFLVALLPCLALGQENPKAEQPASQQHPDSQPVPALDGATIREIFEEAVKLYAREKSESATTEQRKERREEEALKAQQSAADWAYLAMLIAAGALVINVGTVGLIWGTFWQTRRTADAAVKAADASVVSATASASQAQVARDSVAASNRAADAAVSAAEATAKSVAIAANVERPYVYIADIELKLIPIPKTPENDPGDIYGVTFIFKNYGRTPAFVTRVGWGFEVTDEVPEAPQYRFADGLTVEIVIREGGTFSFPVPHNLLVIKPEQRTKVSITELVPYVWGQIRYRDFLGGVAETGFVAFQYPELKAGPDVLQKAEFRFRGPPAYTYQRYREDGSDPS